MMWLLLACGTSEPLSTPNPPPTPPSLLALKDSNIVTVAGTVSDIHAPTRSWLVTTDGQPIVAVLEENGVLEIGGRVAMPADLVLGSRVTVTGRQRGDVLLVQRAEMAAPAAADPATVPPTEPPPDAPGAPPSPPSAAPPAPAAPPG